MGFDTVVVGIVVVVEQLIAVVICLMILPLIL
jgi:hypothetical protein